MTPGELYTAILEAHATPYPELEDMEGEDDEYLHEAPELQG